MIATRLITLGEKGGPGFGAGSRRRSGSRGSLARDPARAGRLGARGHLLPLVLSADPRLPPRRHSLSDRAAAGGPLGEPALHGPAARSYPPRRRWPARGRAGLA